MIIRPERQLPDVTSIPRRPRRRWRPTSIIILVVSLIVLIAIGSVSWWLFSPLFFHTVSSTANPFTNSPSTASNSGTTITPVSRGSVILAMGKFIDDPKSGRGLNNDHGSGNVTIGKTVVLMGYPNGPDRLLALRDDAEAYMIRARCGSSLESLLGCLSDKNRVQPLTTQGNITDFEPHKVVFDARTAEGGSGAPLFGQSGRVIGVSYAIFTENSASNLAVPIHFGVALLQRAGWVSPEAPAAEAIGNENGNNNQTAQPRGSSTAATNSSR